MGKWERWLVPGILAAVGVPFLIAGSLLRAFVPQEVARHAQEVARLPVATAATLNERGAQVLLEGWVSDHTPLSDQPPLVAYSEYHRVINDGEWQWEHRRNYTPTLWVQIPGRKVEIAAGYTLRSTASEGKSVGESAQKRRYKGFKAADPILVVGTLSAAGDRPVVSAAQIAFATQDTYLATLAEEEVTARWMGIMFLSLGSLLTLGAIVVAYCIRRTKG